MSLLLRVLDAPHSLQLFTERYLLLHWGGRCHTHFGQMIQTAKTEYLLKPKLAGAFRSTVGIGVFKSEINPLRAYTGFVHVRLQR